MNRKLSALARISSPLLALALLSPGFAADSVKKPKKEKNPMEWTGSFSPFENPEHVVVKTDAEWSALWKKIGKPAPAADFKRYFAVAVFMGTKPTGGYSLVWEPAPGVIRYRVKKPSGMAIEALTQPYAIKLFEKSGTNEEMIKVEPSHD